MSGKLPERETNEDGLAAREVHSRAPESYSPADSRQRRYQALRKCQPNFLAVPSEFEFFSSSQVLSRGGGFPADVSPRCFQVQEGP